MKILMIDNYDSFTYNLVHLVGKYERNIIVKRNDKITLDEIDHLKPDKIIISPGPGRPEDSKISIEVIKFFGSEIPIFGVCLGHQGIGYVFGAEIINATRLMHGKTSEVVHSNKGLFHNVPQKFSGGRYHSLIIERNTLPDSLEITAETIEGEIMGVHHKNFPIEGVQFHPESVLNNVGDQLISNWLKL